MIVNYLPPLECGRIRAAKVFHFKRISDYDSTKNNPIMLMQKLRKRSMKAVRDGESSKRISQEEDVRKREQTKSAISVQLKLISLTTACK